MMMMTDKIGRVFGFVVAGPYNILIANAASRCCTELYVTVNNVKLIVGILPEIIRKRAAVRMFYFIRK